MKTIKTILIFLVPVGLFITACNQSESGEDHDHAKTTTHVHEEEEGPAHEVEGLVEEVELTAIQMEKIGLQLGGFVDRPLKNVIKVNGYLELPPQNKADVSTMVGGNVKAIKVLQGDYVHKGQVLAVLEHPNFMEWQQEYLKKLNNLDYLEKEYERKLDLAKDNIASQKQLEQAQSEYNSERVAVNGLRSKLIMLGVNVEKLEQGDVVSTVSIRSPIEGYVRKVNINLGIYVEPKTILMQIIDNHHIHIDLLVYEKDINQVHVGQKVLFQLPSQPGNEYEATIYAIGKALEEKEKAVRVHADIDNESGDLLPGMYVDARIVLGNKKIASLPEQAIVTDKGLNYIFIKNEAESSEQESHFHKTQVIKGVSDAGFVQVELLEPIEEGTPIVVEGAFFLMAETKKGEGGGGHHH